MRRPNGSEQSPQASFSKKTESESLITKLIIPIVIALLAGGSAPWWWGKIFPNEEKRPTNNPQTQIITGNNNYQNSGIVTNIVNNSSVTPIEKKPYVPVWQCIPPIYRTGTNDFESTKPNSWQLSSGLLALVAMNQMGCVKVLLDAGADVNSYMIPASHNFGDGPALHLALNQNRWQIAKLLLERGADPNLLTTFEGLSGLDMARGSLAPPDVIAALKEKGAK